MHWGSNSATLLAQAQRLCVRILSSSTCVAPKLYIFPCALNFSAPLERSADLVRVHLHNTTEGIQSAVDCYVKLSQCR
ncbi:unnamed protein product [Urochloa humidicola]